MNLISLLNRSKRMPLDQRYAYLVDARKYFKPRSVDMSHLHEEIKRVLLKLLRRKLKAA